MKFQLEKDSKELAMLFKKHYTLLCIVSFSILKNKASSKDVVQDFFIAYWKSRQRITLKCSFKAYAIKAVKNLSLQALEKSKKEQAELFDFNIIDFQETSKFNTAEKSQKLQALMNKLPEKRKNIFISYVVNGESYSEIAENNGISVNTVKTQMKRSYAFLRRKAPDDLLYFLLLGFYI